MKFFKIIFQKIFVFNNEVYEASVLEKEFSVPRRRDGHRNRHGHGSHCHHGSHGLGLTVLFGKYF